MRELGFDEVMIVNPQERAGQARGVRLMPYYDANYPEMGGYADPVGQEPWNGYGEQYEVADAGEPEYGYCDGLDETGDCADPGYGYADADPNFMGEEPVGYFAQEPYAQPMGYGYGYGGMPGLGACTGQEPCPRCSGLSDAVQRLKNIEQIAIVHLDENDIVRNPLVQLVLRAYEEGAGKKSPGRGK